MGGFLCVFDFSTICSVCAKNYFALMVLLYANIMKFLANILSVELCLCMRISVLDPFFSSLFLNLTIGDALNLDLQNLNT